MLKLINLKIKNNDNLKLEKIFEIFKKLKE